MATKIAGNALYLELVPNPLLDEDRIAKLLGWEKESIVQLIIFPTMSDPTSGELIPPVVMSRSVSPHSPKAQWRHRRVGDRPIPTPIEKLIAIGKEKNTHHLYLKNYDWADWTALSNTAKQESFAFELEMILQNIFADYYGEWVGDEQKITSDQAWAIRDNKPIVIEFTDEDYRLVQRNSTPQAVIRRINKVRGTLDKFPEKLVKFA